MTQEERYNTIVKLATEYIIIKAKHTTVKSKDPYANSIGNKIDKHGFLFQLSKSIGKEIDKQIQSEVW